MRTGQIISMIVGGVVTLFILITAAGSFYTIDQGERGVLLTNGALTDVMDPGLHFKWPFIQSIERISTRQQVLLWGFDSADSRPVMQGYSRDQQPADMRVTVTFHVPANEAAQVYTSYGSVSNIGERLIARKTPQEIKTVFGQYDAVTVIQSRDKFNNDVAKAIAGVVDGPVIIDGVQVENIDFSDAYENAVEARMTAQVEVQKQQQQLLQEKIKADVALAQATGRANSVKAEAEANAYKITKEADASAYKTKVEGEATAAAIKARGDALKDNPGLVLLTQAERWNGILPTTMVPNATVPFMNMTTETGR